MTNVYWAQSKPEPVEYFKGTTIPFERPRNHQPKHRRKTRWQRMWSQLGVK